MNPSAYALGYVLSPLRGSSPLLAMDPGAHALGDVLSPRGGSMPLMEHDLRLRFLLQ
jgi:hypothetical protein